MTSRLLTEFLDALHSLGEGAGGERGEGKTNGWRERQIEEGKQWGAVDRVKKKRIW